MEEFFREGVSVDIPDVAETAVRQVKKSFNLWWIVLIGAIVLGGIYIYKKFIKKEKDEPPPLVEKKERQVRFEDTVPPGFMRGRNSAMYAAAHQQLALNPIERTKKIANSGGLDLNPDFDNSQPSFMPPPPVENPRAFGERQTTIDFEEIMPNNQDPLDKTGVPDFAPRRQFDTERIHAMKFEKNKS